MECSTRGPGQRLKCVRPSLSNSATSLICRVVAIHGLLVRKASRKTLYSALKMRPLPRNGITVLLCGLEERFCEFVVREFQLGGDMANYVSTDSETRAELAGGFVFAGGAARLAVHEAVFADAHVDDGMVKNTELLAPAGGRGALQLCALNVSGGCRWAH